MLSLALVTFLMRVDLQPLPDDQQYSLSPLGFSHSVNSCKEALHEPEIFCSCVVRGFKLFLPRDEWARMLAGKPLSSMDVIAQVEEACLSAILR